MRDVRAEDAAAVAGKAATVPSVGLRVHFMLGDMGRDSNAWTDPDDFRPERFMPGGEAEDVGPLPGPKEIRMMPFGAGRRFCPGMGLAMLHVKLFLAALVREFEWAPVPGDKVDLTELDGFFKTMKKPLRARIAQRLNAAA
jgi:cytochrome P450